jgi:hypothetical protein
MVELALISLTAPYMGKSLKVNISIIKSSSDGNLFLNLDLMLSSVENPALQR